MYPYYRKLNGLDIWYKIVSETEFHELKRIGGRLVLEVVVAVQYPEKLRIQDMIQAEGGHFVITDESAFEDFVKI